MPIVLLETGERDGNKLLERSVHGRNDFTGTVRKSRNRRESASADCPEEDG